MGTAVECCRPFFMSLRSRTAGDCRLPKSKSALGTAQLGDCGASLLHFFLSLRSRTAGDCGCLKSVLLLLQRSSATVVPRCFIYVYKKSQSATTSRRKGTLSNLQIK